MMQTTGNRLVPTWNAYVMAFILIGVLQQGLFQHAAYADDSQDAQRSDGLIDYEYAGKQYYGYLATPPAWRVHGADSASINSNLDLNLKPTSIDQHSIQHNTPNSMTRVVNNPTSVPGILLVHGSHGQTETTRQHARQLADQGYAVFAVDMYGRGVITPSPRSAARRAKSLLYSSSNQLSGRFMAAYNVLSNLPNVDSTRIGAVGYCFGGGVVLAMAEMNVDLAGVVSISGDLNYPEQKKQRHPAQARSAHAHPAVLVLHGASDSTLVSVDHTLLALKKRFNTASLTHEWITYPGADHGFYLPPNDALSVEFRSNTQNRKTTYNSKADQASWDAMLAFFDSIFSRTSAVPL